MASHTPQTGATHLPIELLPRHLGVIVQKRVLLAQQEQELLMGPQQDLGTQQQMEEVALRVALQEEVALREERYAMEPPKVDLKRTARVTVRAHQASMAFQKTRIGAIQLMIELLPPQVGVGVQPRVLQQQQVHKIAYGASGVSGIIAR